MMQEGNATMRADKISSVYRGLALFIAGLAWLGLVLQFWLLLNLDHGVVWAGWRFVSYYTLLTNMAVALVATGIVGRCPAITGPRTQLAVLAAILQVGIVYSVALRATHHPHGINAFANHIVHDFDPPLFLLLWVLGPHGKLKWGDVRYALIPPLAYFAYGMGRGTLDGWYPYYFLDPTKQSMVQLGTSVIVLLGFYTALALALIALDKWMGRKSNEQP